MDKRDTLTIVKPGKVNVKKGLVVIEKAKSPLNIREKNEEDKSDNSKKSNTKSVSILDVISR